MKLLAISDLIATVGSGRIDAVAFIRPRKSPEILRIRMRRGKCWDELWVHASAFETSAGAEQLLQDALNTILDHVSPG